MCATKEDSSKNPPHFHRLTHVGAMNSFVDSRDVSQRGKAHLFLYEADDCTGSWLMNCALGDF